MTAPDAFFEHIALVIHLDDLLPWDRFLRGALGGSPAMGGVEPRAGFQGGQITYPGDGMLEVITWTAGTEEKSANARYLTRNQTRAALHHLTFLVSDFDAALAHCKEVGFEPMVGRTGRNWSEFFVKERSLLPTGFLVQVLRADKDALAKQGWRKDWEPFATQKMQPSPPVRIEGVHLACTDLPAATRVFVDLLGGERDGEALVFSGSSMKVWLHAAEDPRAGHIAISEDRGAPPEEPQLIRVVPAA